MISASRAIVAVRIEGVEQPLVKELEARGYDISTLRLTIRKKADPVSGE